MYNVQCTLYSVQSKILHLTSPQCNIIVGVSVVRVRIVRVRIVRDRIVRDKVVRVSVVRVSVVGG